MKIFQYMMGGSGMGGMNKRLPKYLVLLLIGGVAMTLSFAVSCSASSPDVGTKQFRLIIDAKKKRIHINAGNMFGRIPVPWEWLMSAGTQEEVEAYVSSLNFDQSITSFIIHKDLTGLRISSYEVQSGGSAQAAAGRDIFLVYVPSRGKLYRGGIELGITKARIRSGSCFSAVQTQFLISDINRDNYMDIGVLKEELRCKPVWNTGTKILEGPYYKLLPIQWHVFQNDRWMYSPDLDGRFPIGSYQYLPLIGLVKGPVDYIKDLYPRPGRH